MSGIGKYVTNVMSDEDSRTEEEWKSLLTEKEYKILRLKATEKHGSGEYDNHYPKSGYYACKGCDFPLYSFAAKFDSGCGWPAYNKCYYTEKYKCHVAFAITKRDDNGTIESEILCKRCGGHLGHVFYNETSDGSERHCVNSASVRYKEAPSKGDDDVLDKHFGLRWNELQDGFVADDSIDAIKREFGNDAKFTPSNFHNKSENEKILKDKQQQNLGLFI